MKNIFLNENRYHAENRDILVRYNSITREYSHGRDLYKSAFICDDHEHKTRNIGSMMNIERNDVGQIDK